jgi:hypothetical protein
MRSIADFLWERRTALTAGGDKKARAITARANLGLGFIPSVCSHFFWGKEKPQEIGKEHDDYHLQ